MSRSHLDRSSGSRPFRQSRNPALVAAAAALSIPIMPMLCGSVYAANIPDTYTGASNGQLDTSGNWSAGEPTGGNDALINKSVGTLTQNTSPETFGSLDDTYSSTVTTDTITGSELLTLGGNGDVGNSISGNSADLLYSAGNPLILEGTGGITLGQSGNIDAAGPITINSAINDGGFGFTKTGAGSLALGGANSISGGVAIYNGTVYVTQATGLGSGAVSLMPSSSDNVTLTTNAAINIQNPITVNGTGGTATLQITGGNNVTYSGGATLASSLTVNNNTSHHMFLNGTLSGPGSLTVSDSNLNGIVYLSGASGPNSYTGGTSIVAGTLVDNTTSGGGEGAGDITVAATSSSGTATFQMDDNTDLASTQSLFITTTTGTDTVAIDFSGVDAIAGLTDNGTSLGPGYYYSSTGQTDGDTGGTVESFLAGTGAGELEVVPEPASLGVMAAAMIGVLAQRRRKFSGQ